MLVDRLIIGKVVTPWAIPIGLDFGTTLIMDITIALILSSVVGVAVVPATTKLEQQPVLAPLLCKYKPSCLPVSPHGEFAPTEFAPTSTHLAIKCFKFIFLMPRKKDNIVRKMKLNIFISRYLIH